MFQRLSQPIIDLVTNFSVSTLIRFITVVIDISLVSFLIYKLLVLVRGTRAVQLLKGLSVLVLIYFATQWLHLYTVNWVLGQLWIPGVIALVIIFQPELRLALEQIGRGRLLLTGFRGMEGEELTHAINEITDAVVELADRRFGALIALERSNVLSETTETGKRLDASVSADLLTTVFYPGSTLHDGAVVIRHCKVAAAGCILPLSQTQDLEPRFGTRHRAALGLAEQTDAVVIVVSEETGSISLAVDSQLHTDLTPQELKERLIALFVKPVTQGQRNPLFQRGGGAESEV